VVHNLQAIKAHVARAKDQEAKEVMIKEAKACKAEGDHNLKDQGHQGKVEASLIKDQEVRVIDVQDLIQDVTAKEIREEAGAEAVGEDLVLDRIGVKKREVIAERGAIVEVVEEENHMISLEMIDRDNQQALYEVRTPEYSSVV